MSTRPEESVQREGNQAREGKETARPETERDSHAQTKIDYENAVDPDLIDFKETVHSTPPEMVSNLDFRISKVSDRQRADIERLTGEPVNAHSNFIKGDRIVHIEDRHGKNGSADHSMADPKDVARMAYVLENYDTVDFLRDGDGNIITNSNYTAKDGGPAKTIAYVKRVNGFYIVVEAVNDGKRGRLNIVSAYKNKNNPLENQKTRMHDDTSAPKHNVQDASALTSDTNIPHPDTKSKEKNKNFSETTEPSTKPAENSVREDAPPTVESAAKPEAKAPPKPITMPVALNDVKLNQKISKSGQRQYTLTQIDGKGDPVVRQFVYDPNKTGHLYEIVDGKPKGGKPIFENPNETDVRHIVQAYANGEALTKFKHFEDSEWVSTSMHGDEMRVGKGGGDGREKYQIGDRLGAGGGREVAVRDAGLAD